MGGWVICTKTLSKGPRSRFVKKETSQQFVQTLVSHFGCVGILTETESSRCFLTETELPKRSLRNGCFGFFFYLNGLDSRSFLTETELPKIRF